LISNKVQNCNC